jgi:hypothetical protein
MQAKFSSPVLPVLSLVLFSVASCGTSGPKGTRVHAQRPFISNDTHTTEDKVVAVEAGVSVISGHETEIPVLVKYGLGPQTEFFFETSPYKSVDNDGVNDGSGWGDTFVGFRHRIRDKDMFSPAYGIQVQTKLPSARPSSGLGSGETDWFGAMMATQTYYGVDTTLYYQLGLLGEPAAPNLNLEHTIAIQGRKNVGGSTVAFGEFAFILEPEIDRDESTIMGGVSFGLNPLTALDIGVRLGIGHDSPDFQVLFGISRALGMIFFPEDETSGSIRR